MKGKFDLYYLKLTLKYNCVFRNPIPLLLEKRSENFDLIIGD